MPTPFLPSLPPLSTTAWRPDPDYSRIASLYPRADKATLDSLLARFDDAEKTLTRRLTRLLSV